MAGQKQLTSSSVPVASKGFNGGLNSTASPLTVAANESSKLQNIDFDKFGSILKRSGYSKLANVGYGGIDSYTKLLLHMDGADDGTTFTDSSTSAKTITRVNAVTKTGVSKFGGASGYFDGTGDYLTTPANVSITNGGMETWTGLTDLITDGAMEVWTNPTTLTNWTLAGAGATLDREGTIKKAGTYSAKLTRAGTNCNISQTLATGVNTKTYVFAGWVYQTSGAANRAGLHIEFGANGATAYHSGASTGWEYLTCVVTNPSAASGSAIPLINNTDGSAYFDGLSVYEMLAPTGWTLSGSGAKVAREEGTIKVGTYATKLSRVGADAKLSQAISSPTSYRGKTLTVGVWVYATAANRAILQIVDDAGQGYAYHSGTTGWEYVTATRTVDASATAITIYLGVVTGDTTAYFDDVQVIDGTVTDFQFGSGDFTIDTWAYFSDTTTATARVIACLWRNTTDRGWSFFWNQSDGKLYFSYSTTGADNNSKSVSWTPTINAWYHLAVVRSGNNLYFFVNGTQVGATQDVTGVSIFSCSEVLAIGSSSTSGTPSGYFIGYLDELRISNTARWTAEFTAPTAPYSTETSAPQITGLHWYEPSTGTDSLVINAGTQIYSNDLTTSLTNITGALTLTAGYLWKYITFLNTVYATNGQDAPWKWTGSGNATAMTLPTDVTKPKYIAIFNAYTFIADGIVGGVREKSRLNWSNINTGDTWTDSDFAYISRNDGQDITGLGVLGDRLVIFKDRSIWIGQFTGDVDIPFQFQKTQSHVGCTSGYSIQNVANGLVFMGEDGIYFFDGNQSEKLSNRINETIYSNNLLKQSNTVSLYQKFKNRTWFSQCLGGQTEASQVITFDDYNNAFSLYSGMNPSTMCVVYSSGEEIPIFGDYDGYVYRADYGVDDYPLNVQTAIDAYFYSKWIDYDDLTNSKGLTQADIYYEFNDATLNVTISYDFEDGDQITLPIDTSSGGAEWDTAVFDVDSFAGSGGGYYRLDIDGRGRVVRIGFKNNVLSETFRVDGVGQLVHLETNQ